MDGRPPVIMPLSASAAKRCLLLLLLALLLLLLSNCVPSQKENGPKTLQIITNTKNKKNQKKTHKNYQKSSNFIRPKWMRPSLWMGLLDGIIGLDYWVVFFLPNSEGTRGPQGHSSQGRFFFFVYVIFSKMTIFGQKCDFRTRIFKKMMIFGQILSNWIKLDLMRPFSSPGSC